MNHRLTSLATGAGLGVGLILLAAPGPLTAPARTSPTPTTYNPSVSLAPLVDAVKSAVVSIEVSGTQAMPGGQQPGFGPFQDFFRGVQPPGARPFQGEGSGFIISSDGLVLTNHHVIGHADTITVVLSDGDRIPADVLGSDEQLDVALLKLPADREWPFVALADSDDARVGDWVVAMGNPLDLDLTVTTGIISGKGRNGHSSYQEYLQTDAAINPGNSGGPLFTLDGDVVGMNTAIIQGANTVGFAIPANEIHAVIDDLRTDGRVHRGYLGVTFQPLDDDLREALGLGETVEGVVVNDVMIGLPAATAGVEVGDVVVAVNGHRVDESRRFVQAIGAAGAGEDITLTVQRDGRERNLTATLVERTPEVVASSRATPARPSSNSTPTAEKLGLFLVPLPRSLAAERHVTGGVLVDGVASGSPADGVLKAGDIIVQANRRPVRSPSDAETLFSRSGSSLSLLILRDGTQRFVVLRQP